MRRRDTVRKDNSRQGSALARRDRARRLGLAALLLLDAIATVARTMPPGTIDELLALLSDTEDTDDDAR